MTISDHDAIARAVARDEGIEVPALTGGFGNAPTANHARLVERSLIFLLGSATGWMLYATLGSGMNPLP